MQAGETEASLNASSGEQALAGKGFSKDVEAAFKAKNQNIDFTWVDKMVKMKESPRQIRGFLKDGQLQMAEGGAR